MTKLTLNERRRSPTSNAAARRKAANTAEPLEDAWERIWASKLTDADRRKLTEVYRAMEAGDLGRQPEDMYNKRGNPKKFSKAEALRLHRVLMERQKADKLRELVENTPDNYVLVTKRTQLDEMVTQMLAEKEIAVDTETTGVDVYSDEIVGLSVTTPSTDRHYYVPVAHDTGEQLPRDAVLEAVRPALESEEIGKVLHNAIFDRQMFRRHGLYMRGIAWDTMTAMHLLNENEPSFKLKDLAPKYIGVESDTYGELFGSVGFNEIPLDVALVYGAKDTDITWRLYEFQKRHMRKLPTILEYYETIEVPLLEVIADLESNGYILDLDFAKEYGERLRTESEELRKQLIEELTPYHEGDSEINLNSPQQVRPALSQVIGQEVPNLDAKKTLKPLSKQFPVVEKLLRYKNLTKLSGTYVDKLPKKQNPTTKRWHSRFNPMGTVTGRFSSGKDEEDKTESGFNAQNQPDEVRPMFVPPQGKVLIGADFKAQEIRCVAYMSEEPVLIEAFRTGRDPYAMMASQFYKKPYEDVYKFADGTDTKERKEMKVVWLATLYGMSDFSLADMLGIDKKEATRFREEVFGSMPTLQAWLKANEDFVKKNGYVWADKKYRKRRLPDAKLRKEFIPYGKYRDPAYEKQRLHNAKINRSLRQATNARVQGSSSIQTKATMIKAHEYCKQREGWALWNIVHDELIFEVPEDFTREDADDIARIMVESYPWGDVVENGTDLEVMRRWGDGMTVDEWFAQK